jgi:hypothetical protein
MVAGDYRPERNLRGGQLPPHFKRAGDAALLLLLQVKPRSYRYVFEVY